MSFLMPKEIGMGNNACVISSPKFGVRSPARHHFIVMSFLMPKEIGMGNNACVISYFFFYTRICGKIEK